MSGNRLLIIGADSDLVQPLLKMAKTQEVEVLALRRRHWDLKNPSPPTEVLRKIGSFIPNHLLYAAGLNIPQNVQQDPAVTLHAIGDHFAVNCLSFVSSALYIQSIMNSHLHSIHVISSLYGVFGRRTRLPYAISKHALEGAVKCLATEFTDTLVLAYRPGFFETKLTDKNLAQDLQGRLISRIPAARLGTPDELSRVILQNIINPPYYSSGSVMTMDGGLSAGGIFELT
jgi:NAD(P)-dependent dehydrogenase (short-subunit alcohol dehydrogenase family)